MRNPFLTLIFISIPISLNAGTNSYQCLIKEHLILQEDGSLKRPPIPYLIEQRFSIDRNSGRITGPEPGFAFSDSTYEVLSYGNTQNSFVSTIQARSADHGVHFVYVRVEEFSRSKSKPFVIDEGGLIVSGTCE